MPRAAPRHRRAAPPPLRCRHTENVNERTNVNENERTNVNENKVNEQKTLSESSLKPEW
uniref:Uncharacterized protein n=1 Tax=Oryza sativa subsp. japonica TaxID=39947 RepID=Q6ERQ2_ORYSJ|nr:hypothetical protein [Oryza sativa Japonica Group]BAD33494.1 hypothetical protein [Oryza sativa Japonica Group]